MKTCKRVTAVLLCAIMLIGVLPMGAFAKNSNENGYSAYADDISISGVDGFGSVISKVASNSAGEDTDYGIDKFYIVQDNISYVKYHTLIDCKIVIAIYADDSDKMLGSGVLDVSAEETEVNIEIDIDSLPKYYFMRAFMLDENGVPLCEAENNFESTKSFEKFDSKSVDDFKGKVILNFDDDMDDNFAVLVNGSKEYNYDGINNVLESYDEAIGKYVFSNINSVIKSLSVGDIFTFTIDKDVYLLKVKSVSVNGTKATIYEEKEASYEEFFDYIDLDIDSSQTEEQIEYTTDENVEITGYELYDEGNNYGIETISTQAKIINIDTVASVSCPILKTKDENGYLVGNKDSAFSIRGSWELKVSADINIKCYYDVDWNPHLDHWGPIYYIALTDKMFYFDFSVDLKTKGQVSLTIKLQGDFKIAHMDYVIMGIVIEGDLKLHLEGSLTLSVSVEIKWTIGFNYDTDKGFSKVGGKPKINLYPKGSLTINFVISVKFEPGISLAKVIGAGLLTEVGFEISVVIADIDMKEILNATDVDEIHKCNSGECFDGTINFFLKVTFDGEIFGKKYPIKELKPKVSVKLMDFYIRMNPFSFNVGKCPNKYYRCDITIINNDKKPISNLQIDSGSDDLSPKYKYNISNSTDAHGKVSFFYLGNGKLFTPTFYLNGQKVNVSKIRTNLFGREVPGTSFLMLDTTKEVKFKIDTTATEGGGNGHNGGTGGSNYHMYKALFNENGGQFPDGTSSKVLSIKAGDPITAPSDPIKAGSMFTGWSPDIPDKMPSKDITFTATYGSGNTSYNISGSTLTISGKGDMKNYSSFGTTEWDSKKETIKKVIINSGITSLGNYAFAQLRNLETVSIPNTVTNIGEAAFYECNSLQTVTLPSSVKTLGDYAFFNCYSMSKIAFGDVEQIGNYTFAQCNALTSVSLPKTVISVGDSAFAYCNNLKSVTIKNNNCSIYSSANTIPVGATIYGSANSTAQHYADTFGRNFGTVTTQSVNKTGTIDYSYNACKPDSDYILLNITGYGNGFRLASSNLEYIDQITSDSSGKVNGKFVPRKVVSDCTVLLAGDFGNGPEAREITFSEETSGTADDPGNTDTHDTVVTGIAITNYQNTFSVPYKSKLIFHTVGEAPNGYKSVWFNGQEGSTCIIDQATDDEYKISVRLVRVSDNSVVKESDVETVRVSTGFFARLIAFFRDLFGRLPVYENNIKQ